MDISTPIPIFKTLLALALNNLTNPTTPLKPPMLCFQPEAYISYMSDLNYAPQHYELIPQDIIKSWQSTLFTRTSKFSKEISENSIKGLALYYLEKGVNDLDTTIYQNLNDFYDRSTDDVDRASLSQIKYCLVYGSSLIKGYIALHLMEGTYLGFIDQGYFKRGKEFAFQRMMHHTAKSSALINLSLTKNELSFVNENLAQINELANENLIRQGTWHYRWLKCEKVSDLEYILQGQLKLYSMILENLPTNIPWEYFYALKSKILDFEETLTHLKISFFNHMLDIKTKGPKENQVFMYLNKAVQWINSKFDTLENCPSFEEIYNKTLNLSKDAYESLFPKARIKGDFQIVLNDYIKAITEDQFTAAKWTTLGYETESELAPFNWNKEAGFFENYKRKVDRLFKTQDHLDEIIIMLNDELKKLIVNSSEKSFDQKKHKHINDTVYSCWELRDFLDFFRIKLRLGFLKDVNTRVTHSNKTVWGRMTQSLGNKVFRFALDGEIFDKTESYNNILPEFEGYYKSYKEIIFQINQITQDHNSYIKEPPLTPNEYPVFYDEEDFTNYVHHNEMKALNLNIVKYNLERICSFQNHSYFSNHLKQIQNLSECFSNYNFIKTAIKNVHPYSLKYDDNGFLKNAKNILEEIPIKTLGKTYQKYVISDKNRNTPLDSIRLITSATNKVARWNETGNVTDTTDEFPAIYPKIKSQLYKAAGIIKKSTETLFSLYPLLKLRAEYLTVEGCSSYNKIVCPYLPECTTIIPFRQSKKISDRQPSPQTTNISKISIIEDYSPKDK